MTKINEIYQGFKNLIFKNEEIEAEAEVKLKICFKCPYRESNRCGKCGCYLKAKARSKDSECPDKRW